MHKITWYSEAEGEQDYAIMQTPAGKLALYCTGFVLNKMQWVSEDCLLHSPQTAYLDAPIKQVNAYWDHGEVLFNAGLLLQGTPFQQRVWHALLSIPFAQTMTYSGFADILDSGARAVGNACRNNPYPLIIPCHRIVSMKGIGGYAGHSKGDVRDIKKKLLAHECLLK